MGACLEMGIHIALYSVNFFVFFLDEPLEFSSHFPTIITTSLFGVVLLIFIIKLHLVNGETVLMLDQTNEPPCE